MVQVHRPGGTKLFAGPAGALVKIDAVNFVDGVFQGHRLGIAHKGSFAPAQTHVEIIFDFSGALLGAKSAGGAFFGIDVAGVLPDLDGEPPRRAAEAHHFRRGQDLDIPVVGAVYQLGGDDAHGAVVGGKGLVQLRHDPADGRILFHQVDVKSGVGQVQGGLDAGDAAPHHQDGPNFVVILVAHSF